MNKLSNSIVAFAGNNTTVYEMFSDYWNHYSAEVLHKNVGTYNEYNKDGQAITFAQKDEQMRSAVIAEVERVANCKIPEGMSYQLFASHPTLSWAAFAVVTMMIETILPRTVVDSIGLYTDMRFVDWGDVPLFDVPNRAFPVVSKAGSASRTQLLQKFYRGNDTVSVENHKISLTVDMYAVLAGRQSLAEVARRAVIAIEADMTREAYGAMKKGLTGVTIPSELKVEGAFDMDKLIGVAQRVEAYNFGMKPAFLTTTRGAMKILPSSAAGYRLNTDAKAPEIGLMRTVYDYDLIIMNQVATGDYSNYGLALDDNLIMVVSPGAEKLLKAVVEGSTLTNSNNFYDNADLSSNWTIDKRYGFGYLSGAIAGSYTLQ